MQRREETRVQRQGEVKRLVRSLPPAFARVADSQMIVGLCGRIRRAGNQSLQDLAGLREALLTDKLRHAIDRGAYRKLAECDTQTRNRERRDCASKTLGSGTHRRCRTPNSIVLESRCATERRPRAQPSRTSGAFRANATIHTGMRDFRPHRRSCGTRIESAGAERNRVMGRILRAVSGTAGASVALVAVLAVSPAPIPGQEEKLRDLYARAQAAQQAGEFLVAASHYEELVRLLPDLAEAHANLGSIYYQIREDEKAETALNKALQLNPQLGAAPHFFLGVIAARHQKNDQAIRHLEKAQTLDPSNWVVAYYLGEAYFASRRYSDAVAAFQEATAHPEFRADAYYYLSKAYGALSKAAMDRLGREHPRSFYVQIARGHYHEGRKNWKQAEDAYRVALERNAGTGWLGERLRWVGLNKDGDGQAGSPPPLPDGEATMLSMLYRPPSDREIDALLGRYRNRLKVNTGTGGSGASIYRLAEDYQIASYLTARWISKNDPGSYRAHQLRAQLHESKGETDDAVREYKKALRLKPDLQNVHFAMGSMLWALSRFAEALPELEAELQINPNHPEAHYVLADILQIEGRKDDAKRHLLEALRLQPDLVEAHLAIERIYFTEGEFDKALHALRSVTRLSPDNPTPHYRMSMLYRRLGKAEEAREALEAFQRLQSP